MPISSFIVEKILGVKSNVQIINMGRTNIEGRLSTEHCIKNSKNRMAANTRHGTQGAVKIIKSKNPKSMITALKASSRAVFR